jgi:prolyl-tRNA synthetase
MRQSQLFTKTQKNAPKDEVSLNAQLLIRAGFVDKLMAGVYTFLPLGLRVIKKIENIIREEMNAIQGQEILMPTLQPKENWQKTGRWDAMDDLYKV